MGASTQQFQDDGRRQDHGDPKLLANALTHASGFVPVDGKADNKLFKEVLALARRFGREDDVLHLNLLVASGARTATHSIPSRWATPTRSGKWW